MAAVHQAHLPGNYELYDPDSSQPGDAVCKHCWEDSGKLNQGSLSTVWVTAGFSSLMWWLCPAHAEGVKAGKGGAVQVVRSVQGVVRYPARVVGRK